MIRLPLCLGDELRTVEVNLTDRGRFIYPLLLGRKALAPFLAAGQMAFTLYLMQQLIGLHILYSPLGFDLPTAPGWAWLAGLATMVIVGQLMFANLWMRYFVSGPLEWVWRSLAYWQRQPFRRRAVES